MTAAIGAFLEECRGARPVRISAADWERRIWQFQSALDALDVDAADDCPYAVRLLADIAAIVQRDDVDLSTKGLKITNAIRAVFWEQRLAVQ